MTFIKVHGNKKTGGENASRFYSNLSLNFQWPFEQCSCNQK